MFDRSLRAGFCAVSSLLATEATRANRRCALIFELAMVRAGERGVFPVSVSGGLEEGSDVTGWGDTRLVSPISPSFRPLEFRFALLGR